MLKEKPYFTWRIENGGVRVQAKLNGIILEESPRGTKVSYDMPVNEYMFAGKNRLSMTVYPFKGGDFRDSKVSLSLYVNKNDAPESEKVLLGHICFNAGDYREGDGKAASRKGTVLNSINGFTEDKKGDVIISEAKLEEAPVRPGALYIYQDIELETPFPRWGFLDAEPYQFPEKWSEFVANGAIFEKNLLDPVYAAHLEIYDALKNGDVEKFLDFFDERNTEQDIAMYQKLGTTRAGFKASIEQDLAKKTHELKIMPAEQAPPIVSDNRNLIKLTPDGLIYFSAKDESSYRNYQIYMYKKDGKWVVGR